MSAASALEEFQRRFPLQRVLAGGQGWGLRDTGPASDPVPLFMLPGAGGTGDVFHHVALALAGRGRRVITVTYPAIDDAALLADGFLAAADAIGAARFDLFGSSLGGYLAQLCAVRAPARVGRCMLANTFFDPGWLQRKMDREKVLATPAQAHLDKTRTQLASLDDSTEATREYKSTMLALVGREQSAEAAKAALLAVLGARPVSRMPLPADRIAVLDTADDPVVDAPTRDALRARYQDSLRFSLDAGGHYPALLHPGGFAAAVLRFFSEAAIRP